MRGYARHILTFGAATLITTGAGAFSALANEAEGGAGLPQFNAAWFPSQIFWLAVTFAVLYVFFSRRALPRLTQTLADRQRKIQADLDSARDLSDKAAQIRAAYERNMNRAKERATDTLRQVDAQLKEKTADLLYSYRTKFTQEVARTETELAALRPRLLSDMRAVAADVAAHAATEILATPVSTQEAQSVVDALSHEQQAA